MSHLHRTLLLVAVVLLVTAQAAFAQRGRDTWSGDQSAVEIAGQVRVSGETRGARNINVRLERFGGGIVDQLLTDDIGKFRFQGLPRGIYVIVVSADGYNSAQQQVDLQVILRGYVVFELVPAQRAAELPAMILDARVPLEAQKEFELGRAALAIKDTKVALAHLEKAITLYADFYEAQLLLGTTYINERRWKEAEAALRNALRAKPGSTAALFALGELYRREKRYAEAEKVLEEGLTLDADGWQGYFTLGRVYWEKGDVQRAAPKVGRVLQLKPDFAEAHLLAGNILLRLNAPERALFEYEEYLRLAPRGEFAAETTQLVQKIKTAMKTK